MSDAAIRSTLPPSEPDPDTKIQELPSSPPRRGPQEDLKRWLKPVASLRLTVGLFVFSLLLVFFGTMAQVDEGIWTVVSGYFRSFLAWIPFQLFVRFGQVFLYFPKTWKVDGYFPFPGGLIIGSLLMLNLVAAHYVRFKWTWKRAGIIILHFGIILMLLGELVTGQMAIESKMILANGETANFVDVTQKVELAFVDPSNPDEDSVITIPGAMLIDADPKHHAWKHVFTSKPGPVIKDAQLPVDVEVLEYMKNSDLLQLRDGETAADMRVSQAGVPFRFVNRAEETGVDTAQREDAPAVRVALRDKKTGEVIGKYLLTVWYYSNFTQRLPVYQFAPQQVAVDGKRYNVELRLKRIYKPYTIELKQFHHEVYPGTEIPKDYSSDIRLQDETRGEDREVKIYMNNPLRYGGVRWLGFAQVGGETFYQSGFIPGDRGTVLQVVDNPGAWLPYLSCTLVTLGMIVHFWIHMVGFLSRRAMA